MNWKQSFFAAMRDMDKTAILGALGGPLLMGGFSAMDVASQAKEMKQKVQLNPLKRDSRFKLAPPSAYQFEGGKHSPLKDTRMPHTSLYE